LKVAYPLVGPVASLSFETAVTSGVVGRGLFPDSGALTFDDRGRLIEEASTTPESGRVVRQYAYGGEHGWLQSLSVFDGNTDVVTMVDYVYSEGSENGTESHLTVRGAESPYATGTYSVQQDGDVLVEQVNRNVELSAAYSFSLNVRDLPISIRHTESVQRITDIANTVELRWEGYRLKSATYRRDGREDVNTYRFVYDERGNVSTFTRYVNDEVAETWIFGYREHDETGNWTRRDIEIQSSGGNASLTQSRTIGYGSGRATSNHRLYAPDATRVEHEVGAY